MREASQLHAAARGRMSQCSGCWRGWAGGPWHPRRWVIPKLIQGPGPFCIPLPNQIHDAEHNPKDPLMSWTILHGRRGHGDALRTGAISLPAAVGTLLLGAAQVAQEGQPQAPR